MKKKKISLDEIKVKSFVTAINGTRRLGGGCDSDLCISMTCPSCPPFACSTHQICTCKPPDTQ